MAWSSSLAVFIILMCSSNCLDQGQHRGHFFHGIDVARLEETGHQLDVGIGLRRLAVLGVDRTVQALGHVLDVRVDQLDAVDFGHDARAFAHRANADGAVLADFDLLLGRHGNRPAIADHRHAVASAQYAQGVRSPRLPVRT